MQCIANCGEKIKAMSADLSVIEVLWQSDSGSWEDDLHDFCRQDNHNESVYVLCREFNEVADCLRQCPQDEATEVALNALGPMQFICVEKIDCNFVALI